MKTIRFLLMVLASLSLWPVWADRPDSVYVFAYSPDGSGLRFAWSSDGGRWNRIGPDYCFLSCDYGPWGSEKKMFHPVLYRQNGLWHCVWSLNQRDGRLAHSSSADLVHWKRQSYPLLMPDGGNCLNPAVLPLSQTDGATLFWQSGDKAQKRYFQSITQDYKAYSPAKETASLPEKALYACLRDGLGDGCLLKVPASVIETLENAAYRSTSLNALYAETCAGDAERFAGLQAVSAELRIDLKDTKAISDHLTGIFFEDINYAADGGLYAELVQNRSFEYKVEDTKGRNPNWTASYAWSLFPEEDGKLQIRSQDGLNGNNPHYAVLEFSPQASTLHLANEGFDGMVLKKSETYDFSLFAKMPQGGKARVDIRLEDENGHILAEKGLIISGTTWKKHQVSLSPAASTGKGRLVLVFNAFPGCQIALDMISLFPRHTFMNRPNGLRADLAQCLADLHPGFVRFPGGCVAHGDGLDNIYRWKNTIGPVECRKSQSNIWRYHQSMGLGYFEYFQFCEDIGAEPLPIIAAGVPCQNSADGGQQDGIPMEEMDEYIQDILDLIEWANGDARSEWGRIRAKAGHPKPFNLKYIGIGNEDLITDVFEERFTMIHQAVKEKYPDIRIVGTVGPFYQGTDYEEGWDLADRLQIDLVDEHYYNPPGWFIYNQHFYDQYDRSKPTRVYLGEYASHLPGRPNNLETALSEALYLTSVERNGDVVEMCSYAPLLAKEKHTQWNPDLIYFNNTDIRPTVGYYVQQLYGREKGDVYVNHQLRLDNPAWKVTQRVASSVVRDSRSGDLIVRLVNMLPVSVNSSIHLQGEDSPTLHAVCYQMSGQPSDRNVVPQKSELTVQPDFELQLPAYSFLCLRISH